MGERMRKVDVVDEEGGRCGKKYKVTGLCQNTG